MIKPDQYKQGARVCVHFPAGFEDATVISDDGGDQVVVQVDGWAASDSIQRVYVFPLINEGDNDGS